MVQVSHGRDDGGRGGEQMVHQESPAPDEFVGMTGMPLAVAGVARDVVALTQAMAAGERDKNKLTNAVFYARHPDLIGKSIVPKARPDLAAEWKSILGNLVLPSLKRPPGKPAGAPAGTAPNTAQGRPLRPFGTLAVDVPGFQFSYAFTPDDVHRMTHLVIGEAGGTATRTADAF